MSLLPIDPSEGQPFQSRLTPSETSALMTKPAFRVARRRIKPHDESLQGSLHPARLKRALA